MLFLIGGKGERARFLGCQAILAPLARLWRAHSNWILSAALDVPPLEMGTM
jgi:hypothetical protein